MKELLSTLKVSNFVGIKFRYFHNFWPFSQNFVTVKRFKPQNPNIKYLGN